MDKKSRFLVKKLVDEESEEAKMIKIFLDHESKVKEEFKNKIKMMFQYHREVNEKCSVKANCRENLLEK